MARQHGATLSHYHTKSGDSLELLYPGEMSAEVRKKSILNEAIYFVLLPPPTGCVTKFLIVVQTLC